MTKVVTTKGPRTIVFECQVTKHACVSFWRENKKTVTRNPKCTTIPVMKQNDDFFSFSYSRPLLVSHKAFLPSFASRTSRCPPRCVASIDQPERWQPTGLTSTVDASISSLSFTHLVLPVESKKLIQSTEFILFAMTYASRGRSLVETILAVIFGGFLTGFILVLCIGNYYRAKRAMERQRQRRIARLSNGGGNGVVDSPHSAATSGGGSTRSNEEQAYLLGTGGAGNDAAARRRTNNAMMPLVQEDLLLQENPPDGSSHANVMSV